MGTALSFFRVLLDPLFTTAFYFSQPSLIQYQMLLTGGDLLTLTESIPYPQSALLHATSSSFRQKMWLHSSSVGQKENLNWQNVTDLFRFQCSEEMRQQKDTAPSK